MIPAEAVEGNPDIGPRCPACRVGLVTHDTRDPHCIGHGEGRQVIPAQGVTIYSCVTHGYATKVRDELVSHVDNNAGCKMRVEDVRIPW